MNTVYVLNFEGGPEYVTTDLSKIQADCEKWHEENRDSWGVEQNYHWWIEGKEGYPNTEEGEEQAWNDYVTEQFENGEWGDYAWYECEMK